MKRRPSHLLFLAVATALALLTSGVQAATADPGIQTEPVYTAFEGSLVNDPDVSDNKFTVLLEPDQETLDAMNVGDTTSQLPLPAAQHVSFWPYTPSEFDIDIDPAKVPAAYISANGIITVTVFISEPGTGKLYTMSGSAQRNPDPYSTWVWLEPGKSSAVGVTNLGDGTADGANEVAGLDDSADTADADWDGRFSTATPACDRLCATSDVEVQYTSSTLLEISDRWTIIGTTYPVGVSEAEMKFVNSRSKTITVGVAMNGPYGGWEREGSRTVSSSWGYDWPMTGNHRGYKITMEYGKYKEYYCWPDGGCVGPYYYWRPHHSAGGAANYYSSYPGWNYRCQQVPNGGYWWRDNTDGYNYSLKTGVDIDSKIGFDLRVSRAYSGYAAYKYSIGNGAAKKMCSNKSGVAPSIAPKVNEGYL